jgi:hypothetical protein
MNIYILAKYVYMHLILFNRIDQLRVAVQHTTLFVPRRWSWSLRALLGLLIALQELKLTCFQNNYNIFIQGVL